MQRSIKMLQRTARERKDEGSKTEPLGIIERLPLTGQCGDFIEVVVVTLIAMACG